MISTFNKSVSSSSMTLRFLTTSVLFWFKKDMFCALIALMPELVIKMRRWRNYRAINNSYFTQRKVFAK